MSKLIRVAAFVCAIAVPLICNAADNGATSPRVTAPAVAQPKSDQVAREAALDKLLATASAQKLNDKQTVGDYLKATTLKPEQYLAAVLKGVEELPPTQYLEDGRAQVTVQIKVAALRDNLKQIAQASAKPEAFDTSALDTRADEKLAAAGTGQPSAVNAIPGWTAVTARQRLDVENGARADAVQKLTTAAGELSVGNVKLADAMAKPAVKNAVTSFLNAARPQSKTYYADGTVAVKMEVTAVDLWKSLSASLKDVMPTETGFEAKDLTDAIARDLGNKLAATGYARVDGNPVDAAELSQAPKPVEIPQAGAFAPTMPVVPPATTGR